jgi:pimeloyl-ACP methyl ester carboxylesterase
MTASLFKCFRWALLVGACLSEISASGRASTSGTPSPPPVQQGMVKLTDSDIQYFSQGQGEAIVLLPFGGLTVGYMEGLAQDLAEAGYRVVRINFRGSGKSTGSGEGITLHTLAADVAGVIILTYNGSD